MMLVRASGSGKWHPNSTKRIRLVRRKRTDARGLYAALGVDATASREEIVSAGHRRMIETHPDHGGDVNEFMLVREAFVTLRDEAKRAEYDIEDRVCRQQENPSNNIAGSPAIDVVMEVVLREDDGYERPPAWYKEPWTVLTESDESAVLKWLWLLVDVARDFGYEGEIKAGIVASDKTFMRKDDIALIGIGKEPELVAAQMFVLSQKVGYKDD
jgi:curved DNA-binding protein CbpA